MAVRPEPLNRPKLPPLGRDPQAVRDRLDALEALLDWIAPCVAVIALALMMRRREAQR